MEDKIKYDDEYEYNLLKEDMSAIDVELLADLLGEDFLHGVESMANVVGKIHSLTLVGLEAKDALEYLMTIDAIEHEEKITKETNETTIRIAEIGGEEISSLEL